MLRKSVTVITISLALHGPSLCQTLPSTNPLTKKNFFPITVSLQNPLYIGTAGNSNTKLVTAASQAGINIFHGLKGNDAQAPWPENFGADDGEIAAIAGAGLYVIGGTDVPFDTNDPPSITGAGLNGPAMTALSTCDDQGSSKDVDGTLCSTVASIKALIATAPSFATALIGYSAGDEPDCSAPPYYHPNNEFVTSTMTPVSTGVPDVVNGILSQDKTRIVTDNFAPNVFFGYCTQPTTGAINALSKSWVSFDFYPATIPYDSYTQFASGTNYINISKSLSGIIVLSDIVF